MNARTKTSLILGLALQLICVPGYCADEYKAGADSYAKGDFEAAKKHLRAAVGTNAALWKAHYLLGNTYLRLSDSFNAKIAYENCLALRPPPDVRAQCEQAISYLSRNPSASVPTPGSRPSGTPSTPGTISTTTLGSSTPSSGVDPQRQQLIEQRRARIMKEAETQAGRIRADAKAQIEEMRANSNQRYLYEDGSLRTDLAPGVAEGVTKEAEDKIQRIMEEARRRAAAISTP